MMLLTIIICHLTALAAANPFHKYPFVFLLDIGNEELEKTNSEQIRFTAPGGSMAIRYPAIGNGNMISHVRVSGIDFGTDLKANVVDGGPGYGYVVLMFDGNPRVPYDAVVTIKTVDDFNTPNVKLNKKSEILGQESEETSNNSAEDLSDDDQGDVSISNAELTSSSSNVHSYASDDSVGDTVEDGLTIESIETDNDSVSGDEGYEEVSASEDIHEEEPDIDEISEVNDDESVQEVISSQDDSSNESHPLVIDGNLYSKYFEVLKDDTDFGSNFQEFQKNSRSVYQEDPEVYEDFDEVEPVSDEEDEEKYKDSNNNIDSNDSYAVAY